MIRGLPIDQVLRSVDGQDQVADNGGSTLHNVRAVVALLTLDTLTHRGRVFRVPPLPYRTGVQLYDLQQRMEFQRKQPWTPETRRAHLEATLALMIEAVTLFNTCVAPATWFDKLTWRWQMAGRHGFRPPFGDDTTEAELGDLLAFFSLCRMKSTVPLRNAALGTLGTTGGQPAGSSSSSATDN